MRRVWCCGHGRCATWVLRVLSSCHGGGAVAVVALHGCRGGGRHAACRLLSRSLCRVWVTVAIFAPRVVSWVRLLRRVWCRGRGRCTACGSPLPSLRHVWCHGCSRCTACGSHSPSLRHVWCRGRGCCTACGLHSLFLCHVGCQGQGCCTVCGVAVAGVAVAIFAPHGCHGHSHRTVWCCGRGGCHRAVWCRSCGHHRHVITGPQKRKLVEKRKKKMYKQADAVRAATRGTVTRCHYGW